MALDMDDETSTQKNSPAENSKCLPYKMHLCFIIFIYQTLDVLKKEKEEKMNYKQIDYTILKHEFIQIIKVLFLNLHNRSH